MVGICGGYEYDIHTANLVNLVILDFREYELLLEAESVVASAVEAVGIDTLEVTYAGESEAEELIHKLIHSLTAKSYLNADLHALTELEVCYGLVCEGGNCLLAGDKRDLFDNLINNLGVLLCVAATYVDYILIDDKYEINL